MLIELTRVKGKTKFDLNSNRITETYDGPEGTYVCTDIEVDGELVKYYVTENRPGIRFIVRRAAS